MLDKLLSDSRLYRDSKDYKELLEFVIRLRNFAPFNAMLLQVQKPGLSYAAPASDWFERFDRWPKVGARPLLILRPFGPVALVYDVLDTEGRDLPQDVETFFARGPIDETRMDSLFIRMERKSFVLHFIDAGDHAAGSIRVTKRASDEKTSNKYAININANHLPPTQFATLVHELGHLFLGHLGSDYALKVPARNVPELSQRELEAESVSFIVCARNGVKSKSESYLANFVTEHTTVDNIDIYQIMRAAGQVEAFLGLGTQSHHSVLRR